MKWLSSIMLAVLEMFVFTVAITGVMCLIFFLLHLFVFRGVPLAYYLIDGRWC